MFYQSAAEIDANVSSHDRRVGPRSISAYVNADEEQGLGQWPLPRCTYVLTYTHGNFTVESSKGNAMAIQSRHCSLV